MDLFTDNKYTTWYFNIVSRARARDTENLGYTEKHHVIPVSLGGTDDIVILTAREHYICHRLLIRMVKTPKAKKSMGWALHMMLHQANPYHDRYFPNSKVFERLRVEWNLAIKSAPYVRTAEHQANINAANTKRLKGKKLSAETRAKMSASHLGRTSPRKGVKESEETKRKKSETMKRKHAEKLLLVKSA